MGHHIKDPLARAHYDHLTRQQEQERKREDELRAMIAAGTMTQAIWDSLYPGTRERVRDNSGLNYKLKGLEGWRVAVTDEVGGAERKFIVGKSTGWRPCHLEIKTARSHGGEPARAHYPSVRKIEQVR